MFWYIPIGHIKLGGDLRNDHVSFIIIQRIFYKLIASFLVLDYFLESLKDQYEIVIYTAEQGMTVFPLIEAIDPKNYIAYKLVRDATHFTGGHHVKSLNNLNRDLSKVICIDWNRNNLKFNPENLFCMKRWHGSDRDTSLYDVVTLLKGKQKSFYSVTST